MENLAISGYPLDTKRFIEHADLTATGIVTPVPVWKEGEDGRRQRTDVQATNAAGVPEWMVNVSWLGESWGRAQEKTAGVRVASHTEPQVRRHHRVDFIDLTLNVHVNRDGRLVESFTASGIRPQAGEKQ